MTALTLHTSAAGARTQVSVKSTVDMCEEEKTDEEIIAALFMATWSRTPTEEELTVCKGIISEAAEREEGLGDVLWALINAKEFIYVR